MQTLRPEHGTRCSTGTGGAVRIDTDSTPNRLVHIIAFYRYPISRSIRIPPPWDPWILPFAGHYNHGLT